MKLDPKTIGRIALAIGNGTITGGIYWLASDLSGAGGNEVGGALLAGALAALVKYAADAFRETEGKGNKGREKLQLVWEKISMCYIL